MLISSGIMFLMYRIGRLVVRMYIRRTLAGGESGRTETDQGFYTSWWHHPRSRATQRGRKVKAALLK
jgi:hypothetical protein